MWKHFLRAALALKLVVIATSVIDFGKEYCFLLCESITMPGDPGPKMEDPRQMCRGDQVCKQIMNYTASDHLETEDDRRKTILYLTRYCADAAGCWDHCIFSGASGRTPIVSCVSCMNSTAFGFDGNMIAYAYCTDDRVIPPPDYGNWGPESYDEEITAPPPPTVEGLVDYDSSAEYN